MLVHLMPCAFVSNSCWDRLAIILSVDSEFDCTQGQWQRNSKCLATHHRLITDKFLRAVRPTSTLALRKQFTAISQQVIKTRWSAHTQQVRHRRVATVIADGTMKAVYINTTGPPSVLQYSDSW